MKLGVPWSVKGIRPEARETAKEAARRAGMPLSEWLNTVIINSAADAGIDPAEFEVEGGSDDVGAVHARLDDLTRKIDRLVSARGGPEAYAPPHVRAAPPVQPYIPPAPQLPPVRSGPFADAAAQIAARQRALNGDPPLAARPPVTITQAAPLYVPPPAPVMMAPPVQDLSGLEEQLNRITDQIETLRRPGVEEAINALRGELAEIGHALNDAMPRQALDAIEQQVQGLTARVAEGRDAGVDAQSIANIEYGLAEVREALAHLTPAENLVGFNDAIAVLAEKMDLIVAQKDPATLQQLDSAITTLRGISTHIASNDTVRQLSEDVALLAEKVDRIANATAAGDALTSLEERIGALSDALAARSNNGDNVPVGLEALVHSLTSKIEQLQLSRGDSLAAGHLEDRIVKLVERLDASDNRLGHLEAIERGLADLLIHIEEMRTQKGHGGVRADDGLKVDLVRTQNSIDKLAGTLGHVVDRLAAIEHGIMGRGDGVLELTDPVAVPGKLAARAVSAPAPAPPPPPALPRQRQAAPPPEPKRAPLPNKNRAPLNPELPPDLPLEPGSGPPTRANLAARIAASQAALGDANPAPADEPTGKSGFIAAARRAAKAALAQPQAAAPPARDEPDDSARDGAPTLRERLSRRVKSLFLAASVIAIVIGGLQIGSTYFDLWQPQQTAHDVRNDAAKVAADAAGAPATTAAIEAPKAEIALPGALPPTGPFGIATQPATNPQMPATALSSVPMLTPAPSASSDITGAIAKPSPRIAPAAAPTAAPPQDRLPIAIGGAPLRTAASAGNPAAAYEVAIRFAEGRGVPVDPAEAARWFERAAREGLAPAQFRLGSLYEKGNGVRKDLKEARRLYAAAAAKGNAKAMHNLAVLHAEGVDGKPDYAAAVGWFQKAAARGISDSQYNLGVLAARGLGIEKSYVEAYKWFALAADQGDREAGKKRDEIALRLDAKALATAQQNVKSWVAEPQPEAATTVPVPDGGWDRASTDATPPPAKPKRPGHYEIGKS